MGSTKRVSCASALSGFGAPVFTTVTVRCVPIVGVVLSVRVVVSLCLVRQRISVVRGMFHVHRGREACSSVVQHGAVDTVLLAISAHAKEHDVVMSA